MLLHKAQKPSTSRDEKARSLISKKKGCAHATNNLLRLCVGPAASVFIFRTFAQTGAIRGTVVDSQGAVISGPSARASFGGRAVACLLGPTYGFFDRFLWALLFRYKIIFRAGGGTGTAPLKMISSAGTFLP
jgi:hypothetical protein